MGFDMTEVFNLIKDAYAQGYRRGVEEASVVFRMPAVSSERKAKEEKAMVFSIDDLEALLAEVLA